MTLEPRRLIVMRHAKSAWRTSVESDHQRPLNGRGTRDAPRIGARLAELGWRPDRALSSDATRTRQTWAGLSGPLGSPASRFTRALYEVDADAVLAELALEPDDARTVLVLGHNPTSEDLVGWLTGLEVTLTTANAALLEGTGATWRAALRPRSFTLIDVLRPPSH